jgi:hypothetical protein
MFYYSAMQHKKQLTAARVLHTLHRLTQDVVSAMNRPLGRCRGRAGGTTRVGWVRRDPSKEADSRPPQGVYTNNNQPPLLAGAVSPQ